MRHSAQLFNLVAIALLHVVPIQSFILNSFRHQKNIKSNVLHFSNSKRNIDRLFVPSFRNDDNSFLQLSLSSSSSNNKDDKNLKRISKRSKIRKYVTKLKGNVKSSIIPILIATSYWLSSTKPSNAIERRSRLHPGYAPAESIRPASDPSKVGENMKFYTKQQEKIDEKAKPAPKVGIEKQFDDEDEAQFQERVEMDTASLEFASVAGSTGGDGIVSASSVAEGVNTNTKEVTEKKKGGIDSFKLTLICAAGYGIFGISLESIKRFNEKRWVGKGLEIMEAQEKEYFESKEDDGSDDEESDDEETDDEETDDEETDDEETDDEESDDEESDSKK